MRRFVFRSLKWPFSSKEVNQLLASLERHEKTILLGLQIDQTTLLVDIKQVVKQLRLGDDKSVPAALKAHFMVPVSPNADFVHRPEIEGWIRDRYAEAGRQRMGIVGVGGFGKSQLAINFAYDLHTTDPDTSIFWVHGGNRASFEKSYRVLVDTLELPRRHEPRADVLALVRDWLQRDDVSPWLMILDNAEDVDVFFPREQNTDDQPLASYLPKSARGKILVTSRSMDATEKLVGSSSSRAALRINIMEEAQARDILQRRLDDDKVDDAAACDLVRALGYIPLAINQAAAYINRRSPRVTAESYLHEFRESEQRKESLLRSDKGDLSRDDGVSNSVVVTWQVTFEKIGRDHPDAANLLSLMSQFLPHGIPESMLRGYAEVDPGDEERAKRQFEDDIDVLRGYSLVTPSGDDQWDMHPLVQFCSRSWIMVNGNPKHWFELFLDLALAYYETDGNKTFKARERLRPHASRALLSSGLIDKSLALKLSTLRYFHLQHVTDKIGLLLAGSFTIYTSRRINHEKIGCKLCWLETRLIYEHAQA